MTEAQAGKVATRGTSTGMKHNLLILSKDEYKLGIQKLQLILGLYWTISA